MQCRVYDVTPLIYINKVPVKAHKGPLGLGVYDVGSRGILDT